MLGMTTEVLNVSFFIKTKHNSSFREMLTILNSIIFYKDTKCAFREVRPKIHKNF